MAETFETLRDAIVTRLQTITQIQQVQTDPDPNFTGYPAATVYPSNQESDYQNTEQNERVYAFIVAVFYETASTGVGDALTALYELVDLILDKFDQDPTLTGTTMPTGKTILDITPVPSQWGQVPDKELLKTDIVLRIRVSADMQ